MQSKPERPDFHAVAPAWHTFIILLILFTVSFLSARSQSLSPLGSSRGHVASYASTMILEWVLVAIIWFGARIRGVMLRDLAGGRWQRPMEFLRDLGLAIAFLIVANLILALLTMLLHATPGSGIRNIFPNGLNESLLFLLLALTAGICEEIIFRGYLQKQFTALTKSAAAGLVLQGIAFGASHGYQGIKFMLIIAVYGCLFGLLAYWRRNLRPGMIAHFIQDGSVVFLQRFIK